MTKSTITRERIQRIIRAIDSESYDEEEIREWLSSDEIMELSSMALAAMDSEPYGYVNQFLYEQNGVSGLSNDHEYYHDSKSHIPLYRHAQPAPVVMDDEKLRALFDAWFASDCSFDQSPEASEADNIAWRESYWYVWQRCRAAMFQAGNSPAIPGAWIPVSERLPEFGDYLVTDGCDFDVQLFDGEEFIPGFIWEDKITHWMLLPAAPQEVK